MTKHTVPPSFDLETQFAKIYQLSDVLPKLKQIIPRELFRSTLEQIRNKGGGDNQKLLESQRLLNNVKPCIRCHNDALREVGNGANSTPGVVVQTTNEMGQIEGTIRLRL